MEINKTNELTINYLKDLIGSDTEACKIITREILAPVIKLKNEGHIRFSNKTAQTFYNKEKGHLTKTHKRHLGLASDSPRNINSGRISEVIDAVLCQIDSNGRISFIDELVSALKKNHRRGAVLANEISSISKEKPLKSIGSIFLQRSPPKSILKGRALQYIDLFDDELYTPSKTPLFHNNELQDQLNTIRYQVFLAILFDKIIVIPEQWAISSATCVNVIGEVLSGINYRENFTVPSGSNGTTNKLITPPIAIAFMDRGVNREVAYLTAFINRLDCKHRIRLSHNLAIEGETIGRAKMGLSSVFKNIVNNSAGGISDDYRFQSEIQNYIDDEDTSINLRRLYQYICRHPNMLYIYKESSYRQRITNNVIEVENSFKSEALRSNASDEINEFREFFLRVEKENIPRDQIMAMQKLTDGLQPKSAALIKKMGRFVMHNALADNIGAKYITSFCNAFDPLNKFTLSDKYDQIIIDQIRREHKYRKNISQKNDTDFDLLAIKASKNAGLKADIYWPAIWESIWAFSISTEWEKLKAIIGKAIENIPFEKRHEHEVWEEVFETINLSTQFFHLAISNQSRDKFVITMPISENNIPYSTIPEDKKRSLIESSSRSTRFSGYISMLARIATASREPESKTTIETDTYQGRDFSKH